MTNAVAITENPTLMTKEQLEKRTLSLMVKNQTAEDFDKFAVGLITYAVVFKGQNKTDKEIRLMAKIFSKECNERFKYLTIPQIEQAVKHYHYGEYGVTPEGLVKCVEDYYPVSTRMENARMEKQIQERKEQISQNKVLSQKEKCNVLYKNFEYWKKYGKVDDLSGRIYAFAREYTKYKITPNDRKRYLRNAKENTNDYFFYKYKVRFRNARMVAKDRIFCISKEYRRRLQSYYCEYWLRDFFRRSKWNNKH